MGVPEGLCRAVRTRAYGRCQYCLMDESLQGATFHVEHAIPRRHGGGSNLGNLVLACPGCNLHKGSKISAVDPATGHGCTGVVCWAHPPGRSHSREGGNPHFLDAFSSKTSAMDSRLRGNDCVSGRSNDTSTAARPGYFTPSSTCGRSTSDLTAIKSKG